MPGSNGTAKLLAEALTRHGFITLRFDKLGSGPHVRENLPNFTGKLDMRAFMGELRGGVETLVSKKNVDSSRIYAVTNSEGAVHAVNYQLESTKNPFKGLVLRGPPGRPVGEVARTQFLNQSKSFPNGQVIMEHYDEAIAKFVAGKSVEVDPSLPMGLGLLFRSLQSPHNLPFSRELWTYDLSQYLKKITDPILVVIGKKDIQVDWKLDGNALESAAARNPRASFVYPENANHLLKHEELPREKLTPEYVGARYNAQDARLDTEAANAIFSWLAGQAEQDAN